MDLARSLKVCGGAEGSGQVWAEGVVYATGGGTVWRDDGDTFLYQRMETPTATPVIDERHLPTGAVRRVTDGANHLVAGGGMWAVRRKSGYEDSHGHHETGWFPLAVDDLGMIAVVTHYQSGTGLALWDGASVSPIASVPIDKLEACFRNGVLVYRSAGRLYITAVGGQQHVEYGSALPHVSGVQHDGHGHLIGWHEAHGLVVYTAGDDRGLVVAAGHANFSARLRPQSDGTLLLVSSYGAGERLHELRRYVVDLAASTVNGAPHAVVDLRIAPPGQTEPSEPAPVDPATVTITSYEPRTGAAPLKVRAVASFTGPVVSLRWRSRVVAASSWVTAATNPASDIDHTFTFAASGEYELGVDALDADGRILDATGAPRRVTATGTTPAPVRELLSTLQPGDRLERGESLVTRRHRLALDANGVLALTRLSDGSVLWSVTGPSDVLVMQDDGNLVLYREREAVWHSGTHGHPSAFAILQDDGNFVVYNSAMTPLWSTGTVDPVVALPVPDTGDREVRTGLVRRDQRAFVDDQGAINALGFSLFWLHWGERHDPDRLDRNLRHVTAQGGDFVRTLCMVGAPSWEDRKIDPKASDYWAVVDASFARLARHGVRAAVTVFADAQVVMPDQSDRRVFARAWGDYIEAHRSQVVYAEVANEHWQNGISVEDARELALDIRSRTSVPLALSSTEPGGWCRLYAGSVADVATLHYDRDVSLSDGVWRPYRQPWGFPGEYEESCAGGLPEAVANNESIGPDSSVASDADPLRLALGYVTTFVAGNGAFVYHTGAGIRGGGQADLARGRKANLYDYPADIIGAIGYWRRTLPAGLANWTRFNTRWAGFPFAGATEAVDRGAVMRFYLTQHGVQWIGVVLDVSQLFTVTARIAGRWTLCDPRDGRVVTETDLGSGGVWTIPTDLPGYVVRGVTR